MGVIIFALSMSVSGITFGMSKGWSLALIIMGMFPLISIGAHYAAILQRQGFSKSLKAYILLTLVMDKVPVMPNKP